MTTEIQKKYLNGQYVDTGTAATAAATAAQKAQQFMSTAGDVLNSTVSSQGQQTVTRQPSTNFVNLYNSTSNGLNQNTSASASGNYSPSNTVNSAISSLDAIIANQPGAFQSAYLDQLNGIYNQILGRKSFKYDLATDPMYQNYRQQYMQAGRNAMEDTMGQAAALTGGYGSSYSATAGQQAYNQYLQQLNDRVPELYGLARDAYNAEGDALAQQYAMVGDAYNREYGEWQDNYNRWYDQLNFEQDRFEADRNYDLQKQSLALEQQALQQSQAAADRAYYYDLAMSMISMGKVPPDSILLQAGMTQDEIEAIRAQTGGGSSGGSSSKKTSGSSSSTNTDYNKYLQSSTGASNITAKLNSASSSASSSNSGAATPNRKVGTASNRGTAEPNTRNSGGSTSNSSNSSSNSDGNWWSSTADTVKNATEASLKTLFNEARK